LNQTRESSKNNQHTNLQREKLYFGAQGYIWLGKQQKTAHKRLQKQKNLHNPFFDLQCTQAPPCWAFALENQAKGKGSSSISFITLSRGLGLCRTKLLPFNTWWKGTP
jgi:hypothetical protein